MNEFARRFAACVALLTVTPALAAAPDVRITGTPPGGTVGVGEAVHWMITAPTTVPAALHYRLRLNNATTIEEGDLAAGAAKEVVAKADGPAWLYLDVSAKEAQGSTTVASAGVLAGPDLLRPRALRPDDFDAFWAGQVQRLGAVPANAVVKPVDAGRAGVQLFEVTLDNVDGNHVHAQLARPAQGERFLAIAFLQWAGVYPLQKGFATGLAAQGWLVIDVMAHDLPLYEPKAFYDRQNAGPLKNYVAIGNASRDTSYFRKMFLGDYQAIEYLTGRPDWDGRVLVARGESQGGMQSFAMAALHPKVTAMVVSFPAGCDTQGPALGWPSWPTQPPAESRAAILDTSRYFDPAHFAPMIHCPALVALGLRDVTAPPPSVLAAYNGLAGPKELLALPDATHQQNHEPADAAVAKWLTAILKTGRPPSAAGS